MEKANIMIVEDEVLLAMSMKIELNDLGYNICKIVSSGEDAIKSAKQAKPDIILMDIILNGEMNGIEAAREICSNSNIPIIFTTGCEDAGTRKLASEVKPSAYLIKPIEIEDLRLAIEKAL